MCDVSQQPPASVRTGSPEGEPHLRAQQGNLHRKRKSESHESSKSSASPAQTPRGKENKPKRRRRKVNHACIYCQRSHMTCDEQRPCTRCVRRSIGHLCHDEPRETRRSSKSEQDTPNRTDTGITSAQAPTAISAPPESQQAADAPLNIAPTTFDTVAKNPAQTNQTVPDTSIQELRQTNQNAGFQASEWPSGTLDYFPDADNFPSKYLFNTSELTNEYNLLNNFLYSNLLDESLFQGDNIQGMSGPSGYPNTIDPLAMSTTLFATSPQPQLNGLTGPSKPGVATPRGSGNTSRENVKEKYYLTAADPAGTDTPEERMNKLLKAKYDAGFLKPYNYVRGYQHLQKWMENHIRRGSRERILQQLDTFRPKFRERIQKLDDIDLVSVEVWFERRLMEYDRVFASMAIPACCWRRTGEIFRGNREMADIINVPLEELTDGKLALHLIMAEDSLVAYWEKFCSIAFDATQKGILTSCVLRPKGMTEIKCCFSFTILRDTFEVPALIVGNFLPVQSLESSQ